MTITPESAKDIEMATLRDEIASLRAELAAMRAEVTDIEADALYLQVTFADPKISRSSIVCALRSFLALRTKKGGDHHRPEAASEQQSRFPCDNAQPPSSEVGTFTPEQLRQLSRYLLTDGGTLNGASGLREREIHRCMSSVFWRIADRLERERAP